MKATLAILPLLALAIHSLPSIACSSCAEASEATEPAQMDDATARENAKVRAEIEALQAQDKAVVVAFHSRSCSSCKKQKPALEQLFQKSEYQGTPHFLLEFEKSADLRSQLRVRSPSTIVVLKGASEVARVIGETDPAKIEQILRKAL